MRTSDSCRARVNPREGSVVALLRCIALVFSTALAASVAIAQPLRADHPLVGTWKITAASGCTEIYVVRPDGTASVTSAEEVAEAEIAISDQPSEKGFYKWVEKTVKDNGKKDCTGETTAVGHVATNYVMLHPSKNMFAMCERDDASTCVGPFRRIQ